MRRPLRALARPFLRLVAEDFKTSLQRPRQAQQQLLRRLVGRLAATEYGRGLGVKTTDGYDEFQSKVPIVTYDDLSDWVERQQHFERRALVGEPVLFYERTSGSSAAAKLIPYTQSLKDSFNRMFFVWLADLLANAPPLRTGKTFISVSPVFRQTEATARGVPIGLADDAAYLHRWAQFLLNPFFVLPPEVKRLHEPENFKRAVATLLCAEARLEIISIWNPSFLEIILDTVSRQRGQLLADLRRGRLACEGLEFTFRKPDAARLALLAEDELDWQRVWSDLKIISCWTSAHAAAAAARLGARFPTVFLQGKGLLATEAPLTLPLVAARGAVPLPAEVFYEFLDEESASLKRLHEVEVGREYEIVLTQQGGLWRYRIGDRVRVTHTYQAAPCLEFIGRADDVCDLVGEKLSERFVQRCLARLPQANAFQLLLPVMQEKPHYLLITDTPLPDTAQLATALEDLLAAAYHYRQARLLGQLDAVRVLVVPEARDRYFAYFVAKGMKLGDIKPRALLTDPVFLARRGEKVKK